MTTRIYERHDPSFGSFYDADEILETAKSEWQEIQVFATKSHGRVMLIDGLCMLTDDTHFVYHEHMAHIPMACVEKAKDVLIIGGGDGGCATELSKYDEIERIVLAELDQLVIDVSKRWFPEIAKGLNDPRVEFQVGDGAAYVAAQDKAFDVVIIDSTDICEEVTHMTDAAFPLATDDFYANVKKALRPGGVVVQVLGNAHFYARSMTKVLPRLTSIWPQLRTISMPTPFYITGDWIAGLYSEDGDLTPRRFPIAPERLDYINPETAAGALAQPNFLRRMAGTG